MKIGSLFIALGFQTNGVKELQEAEKTTSRVAVEGTKAALAIGSLGIAFGVMVDMALNAATALNKFRLTSGLSTDQLQQWQYAAEKGNVSGQEITDTILGIQKAQADIKLGRGNIMPWQLLGVNPNQDPMQALSAIRTELNKYPADIARVIAAEAGISDNVFQMLRDSNFELGKLKNQFIAQSEQAERLARLRGQWNGIKFEIKAIGLQITEVFRPGMELVLRALQKAAEMAASFAKWLTSGSVAAEGLRIILIAVAAVVTVLGVAISGLAASAAVLTGILAAASVLPAVWAFTLLSLAVLAVGAAIAGLIALYQDLWVASKGGQSLFDWKQTIAGGNVMAAILETIIGLIDTLRGHWRAAGDDFKAAWGDLKDSGLPGYVGGLASSVFLPKAPAGSGGSNSQTTNSLIVHVDGAKDPETIADRILEHFTKQVGNAAYQTPVTTLGP